MTEETENNFAEFEAAAIADTPAPEADTPTDTPPNDVDDAGDAADHDGDSNANDQADDEHKDDDKDDAKRRSKPAHKRIAEITAKLRQTERDLAEARQPKVEAPVAFEEGHEAPDPDQYDFGEADPKYLRDLTKFEVRQELASERKAMQEEAQKERAAASAAELDTKWDEQVAKGAEKYADFNETVLDSAAAGEWACPPLVAAAISVSPLGADVAYHLATHPDEAAEIAQGLEKDPVDAARRFGLIEGGFMDEVPSGPSSNHPMDVAIFAGRLQAFLNKSPKATESAPIKTTSAPEPFKQQVRGAGGRFDVGADTTDFAAFERKANAKR